MTVQRCAVIDKEGNVLNVVMAEPAEKSYLDTDEFSIPDTTPPTAAVGRRWNGTTFVPVKP